jgi:hypothetical protein
VLEADNALRVEPSAIVPGEYVVSIKNLLAPDWDADNFEDRTSTAKLSLASQCPDGTTVLGETVINNGTYGFGRPARTYVIRVRCV